MTPVTLSALAKTLDDVYFLGLLDAGESPPQVWPQYRLMYLEVGGNFLELRCIEDTGTLLVQEVAEFSDVPWNSDGLPAVKISVREFVLVDSDSENQIEDLRLMDASFGPSGVTCAALELRLQNGQVVFFDPSYHFGIRIGGIEQEATWRKNWPGAESLDVWSSQAGFHR